MQLRTFGDQILPKKDRDVDQDVVAAPFTRPVWPICPEDFTSIIAIGDKSTGVAIGPLFEGQDSFAIQRRFHAEAIRQPASEKRQPLKAHGHEVREVLFDLVQTKRSLR